MPAWPAKDPQSVADYRYDVALDEGDTLASIDLTLVSGSVSIDDTISDGTGITAWLSGGTNGEIAVFRALWTTAAGRTLDDIITLPVIDNVLSVLTGYDKPTPAHLIARYPAFAAVPVGTISYWLSDAGRIVTDTWDEGDYAAGLMSLAAHNMVRQGLGSTGAVGSMAAKGVTSFRSASMSVQFDASAAARRASAGYDSTDYGAEFAVMLRRNVGSVRLVGCVR